MWNEALRKIDANVSIWTSAPLPPEIGAKLCMQMDFNLVTVQYILVGTHNHEEDLVRSGSM
jgi:hypothetical protein